MNFEYEPLGKVVTGLEYGDDLTLEEIRERLRRSGYDPDSLQRKVELRVQALSARSRLAWQEVGRQRQAKLNAVLSTLQSWTQRSATEIERAFNDALDGRYGPQPQLRIRTAFNNLRELTPESKAAFLDELDLLSMYEKSGKQMSRSGSGDPKR